MADPVTPTPDPAPTPPPPPINPGWKTTEFWMSLAATLISGLIGSGVIPTTDNWQRIVAIVVTVFAAFGYTITRTGLKKGITGLVLVWVSISASGCCYNKNSPDYSTPKCIIARGSVDCTLAALKDQAPRGLDIVMELLSKGTFDVPALLDALKAAGITDGECILALVADEFMNKPTMASTDTKSKYLYGWSDWRAKNRPNVKYKLPPKDRS